ncbi:helix-turn-helix domain-containing protein [Actinacidiphila glaucinigra]|uniref:helix-turn-helix domain-containing protein n=1 Tax=Actinacidiphila glaucinigra TaxID=235986 RepID=UPI00366D84E5
MTGTDPPARGRAPEPGAHPAGGPGHLRRIGYRLAQHPSIAKRAGVGAGTLYRHFPSREALVLAVYRDDVQSDRLRRRRTAASAPGSPRRTCRS